MNLSVVKPCEKYWNIGKYSVITHFATDLFPPEKIRKPEVISSLHFKVPQKVTGISLNFFTELAFELDQKLLFFRNFKS